MIALVQDALLIVLERHRRGPKILSALHRIGGEFAPGPRQRQAQFRHGAAAGSHRQRLDEFAFLGFVEQLIHYGAGQFQRLGDLRRRFEILREHAFHGEFEQQRGIDARGGQGQRRLRRILEHLIDLFLGQDAKGDHAFTESATIFALMFEGALDVFRGNQSLGHQDIAQVHFSTHSTYRPPTLCGQIVSDWF